MSGVKGKGDKAERLAAQLRENLRRRKAQARDKADIDEEQKRSS